MNNPYDPPEFPRIEEKKGLDEDWVGRECFGVAILLLALFYVMDTFLQVISRYSNLLEKL